MLVETSIDIKLREQVKQFIESRKEAKLAKLAKNTETKRKKLVSSDALQELEINVENERKTILAAFQYDRWLDDAAKRASRVNRVTHAPKYTHGDAKGNGVYLSRELKDISTDYLCCSHHIGDKHVDIMVDAAALDVASFLQIEVEEQSILDQVSNGDLSALTSFAKSDTQLKAWLTGFSQVFIPKELSSHKLSKQIYFPVSDSEYHLLSPLFATSLLHEMYERITHAKFSEEAKNLRALRRANQFSESALVEYRNLSIKTYGGSNKQNISKLNVTRGGISYLLSSQPPNWRSATSPPGKSKVSFWNKYNYRVRDIVKSLRLFLEKGERRSSTKLLRDTRAGFVEELVSEFLQYSGEIQSLTEQSGWSAESKLPLCEQYWLDPLRSDSEFQEQRQKMEWVEEISEQFSIWLNSQLNKSIRLSFGDAEYSEWKSAIEDALKRDLRLMAR